MKAAYGFFMVANALCVVVGASFHCWPQVVINGACAFLATFRFLRLP